jgi:two-component system, NarL family, nitrate/nitrite response regulator NarL
MSAKRTPQVFVSGRDKPGAGLQQRPTQWCLPPQSEVVFPNLTSPDTGRQTKCILILSGDRLVQEALAAVLAHTLACTNIRAVTSLAGVQAELASTLPDLVIIDGNTRHSLAAAMLLKQSGLDSQVIIFGVEDPVNPIPAWSQEKIGTCLSEGFSVNALAAGPVGRASPEPEEAALSGGSQGSGKHLSQNAHPSVPILTAREDEVARLIMSGESNKDIARSLNISLATVKSHVHNLLAKLGLKRRGQLGRWYEAQLVAQRIQLPARPDTITIPAEAHDKCPLPLR